MASGVTFESKQPSIKWRHTSPLTKVNVHTLQPPFPIRTILYSRQSVFCRMFLEKKFKNMVLYILKVNNGTGIILTSNFLQVLIRNVWLRQIFQIRCNSQRPSPASLRVSHCICKAGLRVFSKRPHTHLYLSHSIKEKKFKIVLKNKI